MPLEWLRREPIISSMAEARAEIARLEAELAAERAAREAAERKLTGTRKALVEALAQWVRDGLATRLAACVGAASRGDPAPTDAAILGWFVDGGGISEGD